MGGGEDSTAEGEHGINLGLFGINGTAEGLGEGWEESSRRGQVGGVKWAESSRRGKRTHNYST